jgi:hypothetical protein
LLLGNYCSEYDKTIDDKIISEVMGHYGSMASRLTTTSHSTGIPSSLPNDFVEKWSVNSSACAASTPNDSVEKWFCQIFCLLFSAFLFASFACFVVSTPPPLNVERRCSHEDF